VSLRRAAPARAARPVPKKARVEGSGTSEAMSRLKVSEPFGSESRKGVVVGAKIGAFNVPVKSCAPTRSRVRGVGGGDGIGNEMPPPEPRLEKVMSAVKSMPKGEPGSNATMMASRVKLTPGLVESGVGFEGSEKVKVLPPPLSVKSSVSALDVSGMTRRAASDRTLKGRCISLNSFQKMQGYGT
jgi:hypothetical protein